MKELSDYSIKKSTGLSFQSLDKHNSGVSTDLPLGYLLFKRSISRISSSFSDKVCSFLKECKAVMMSCVCVSPCLETNSFTRFATSSCTFISILFMSICSVIKTDYLRFFKRMFKTALHLRNIVVLYSKYRNNYGYIDYGSR